MKKKAREYSKAEQEENAARVLAYWEWRGCHVHHFRDHPGECGRSAMRVIAGCGSLSIGEQTSQGKLEQAMMRFPEDVRGIVRRGILWMQASSG